MPESEQQSRHEVPEVSRDQRLDMFYAMALARAAEERLEVLFRQGHIGGGVYRSLGQEAGAVGAAFALRRRSDGTGDIIAPTVRATGAVFLMGGTPLQFFRQYLSRVTGPTQGKEANVHWVDYQTGLVGPVSPLGTMLEVMAGITLAFKLRNEERVGMVFGGDGASSTGAWHEGLVFAASQACPMVLMVEANQWAFSTPTRKNTRVKSFTEKAAGYGIHAESVDGTDVIAVYAAVERAAARARAGEGAGMVELQYYRRLGHAQHDAQEYVDPAEISEWEKRDPLAQFRQRLWSEGWATGDQLDGMVQEAFDQVHVASETALAEPMPEGPTALDQVYTDLDIAHPWTRERVLNPQFA